MRTAVFASLLAASVAAQTTNPPRDPTLASSTGTGVIRGRVVAADTGAPIRRAQVTISGNQRPRMVFTDAEGRYAIGGLAAGNYMVSAGPGQYRATFVGSTPIATRPRTVELRDGQILDRIDFALPRAGVIVGTVTDLSGEPVSRIQVTALMARRGGEPRPGASAQTNDLGEYRLFGLGPGEYLVVAALGGGGSGGPYEIEGEATGFAPSYAPGTPSPDGALRIRVSGGTQATVDIKLVESRLFTIRGTVVTSAGVIAPERGVHVTINRSDGPMGFGGSASAMTQNGGFVIRNVVPGRYELVAQRYGMRESDGARVDALDEMAMMPIEVTADIDGVVLTTQPGATVVGQAIFDDGIAEGRRVQIYPQPVDRRQFTSPNVDVKETTFTMKNMFGRFVIRGNVMGGGPPESSNWGLKAVLLNGRDITDEPRVFTSADSGRLQVVFTSRASSLDGTVTDESGQPLIDCVVVLFGEDPRSWQPQSSFFRVTRPQKGGAFRMRGLREGTYRIVALPPDMMFGTNAPDVQFLESVSKVATPIVLNAAEGRTIDLKVRRIDQ